jgi:hypothetical protein
MFAAPGIFAADPLPQTTHDGLVLQKDTRLEAVYLRPGVDFSVYNKVALLDCAVAFRKDWQKDRTANRSFRVSKEDMDDIRARLAGEFRKVFVTELQDGGYQVVEQGAADVLVLRPAIINLDVVAPVDDFAGRGATFSTSAGQMTLYLEVYDSVTSEILARVVDTQGGRDTGAIQMQGGVTNKAEASRILKKWAKILRNALDVAHGSKAP